MLDPTTTLEAFAKIVDSCLNIKQNEQLVVLYDESSSGYLEALSTVSTERGLPTTFLYMPLKTQRQICDRLHEHPRDTLLPLPVEQALSLADGVLNLVSGATETLPFRKALLRVVRQNNCRFAHVPGISDEIIKVVSESPFDLILEHSELVAWAIGGATNATLVTADSEGRQYTLYMDLGGWKNEPLMSPGLLFPGSWGNLPPGETFCCPDPQFVNGKVCISGSVPDYVIGSGEEVVLTFEAGRLTGFESSKDSPALQFFERARKKYEDEGDRDWSLFAELGIGLNPAIPMLTGNSLYDEKVAGTVHVAIGENTYFGHNNKSGLHADLAILRPTLTIGEEVIVEGGRLNTERIASLREQWVAPSRPLSLETRIRMREADVVEVDGRAYRRLCKANRVGRVSMTTDETAKDLYAVTKLLADIDSASVEMLAGSLPQFDLSRILKLLDILLHYECIELKK